MKNIVRFAPSPTGQIHIGNIRTAIFNWLFARHTNGDFLLRIEDTDKERSTQDAIDKVVECMKWLDIENDKDIYYQSNASDKHLQSVEQLINNASAYKLAENAPVYFRIPWDTDNNPLINKVGNIETRVHPKENVSISISGINFALISKKGKPIPESASLAGFHQLKIYNDSGECIFELEKEIDNILKNKASFNLSGASKFKFERREVFFNDIIKGRLSKPLDTIKDLIILRTDGSPVFHIANVCDDISQQITHIIRGDDHIENTYRHILLFQALGTTSVPLYAHLPMIVNDHGKPYSKRDGDAFVGDFKEKGYLPNALLNFLTLLGWSPGDDREKMTKQELIAAFTLERVRSAPSQLDVRKLKNMNGQYIAEIEPETFKILAKIQIKKYTWAVNIDDKKLGIVLKLMQSRIKLISDLETLQYFFVDEIQYDEKAVKKNIKKDGIKKAFTLLIKRLEIEDFKESIIETVIHNIEEQCEIKQGKLNQSIRVAITGLSHGAGIYETMKILGKETVLKRISYFTIVS